MNPPSRIPDERNSLFRRIFSCLHLFSNYFSVPLQKQGVAPYACLRQIPGVKRNTVSFGRVVRVVCSEMAPPFSVVVPKVVVGVTPVYPDRQF